jgi:hypothetical protein
MTDFSNITTGLDTESARPIAATSEEVFEDIGAAVAAFPGLTAASAVSDLARLVTHFARGGLFSVIQDPGAFADAFRARIDSEDPAQPWQQSAPRLADAGLPDFAEIRAPLLEGNTLTWTVKDGFTGLPYRAETTLDALDNASFSPLPLEPVVPRSTSRRKNTVMDLADDETEASSG